MELMPSRVTRFARLALWIFRDSLLNKGMASVGAFNFNVNLEECFGHSNELQAGYLINDSVQIIEVVDQQDSGAAINEWRQRPFMFPNRTIQTYSLSELQKDSSQVLNPNKVGAHVWNDLSN